MKEDLVRHVFQDLHLGPGARTLPRRVRYRLADDLDTQQHQERSRYRAVVRLRRDRGRLLGPGRSSLPRARCPVLQQLHGRRFHRRTGADTLHLARHADILDRDYRLAHHLFNEAETVSREIVRRRRRRREASRGGEAGYLQHAPKSTDDQAAHALAGSGWPRHPAPLAAVPT
mgnify:CR=1 FL=1